MSYCGAGPQRSAGDCASGRRLVRDGQAQLLLWKGIDRRGYGLPVSSQRRPAFMKSAESLGFSSGEESMGGRGVANAQSFVEVLALGRTGAAEGVGYGRMPSGRQRWQVIRAEAGAARRSGPRSELQSGPRALGDRRSTGCRAGRVQRTSLPGFETSRPGGHRTGRTPAQARHARYTTSPGGGGPRPLLPNGARAPHLNPAWSRLNPRAELAGEPGDSCRTPRLRPLLQAATPTRLGMHGWPHTFVRKHS